MHLILTGATGLVGTAALSAMLKNQAITKITLLTRRPVPMAKAVTDPRVNVIIHDDFSSYSPSILQQLNGAEGCVWALGVSQNQVNAEEYVSITRDYALTAARAFSGLQTGGGKFRFIYVSGEGATQTPGRFTPIFGRVKGETETRLGELSAEILGLEAHSVRPALVDPSAHREILKYVPEVAWQKKLERLVLGPVVRNVVTGMHSPTEMLGSFLTRMAMGDVDDGKIEGRGAFRLGGSWVIGSAGARRIMGI